MEITKLSYSEIAERYDLGSLKTGGDFQLTEDGDLATTVDYDIKIGDDLHNALHRVVVRWQMEAPVLSQMFEDVLGAEDNRRAYETMIEALLSRKSLDVETTDDFLELQEAIGQNQSGPGNLAGAIAVALYNLLKREWVDLGRPHTWETAGAGVSGHSFGTIIEATANNFRHADEWAREATPNEQQLRSIRVLADVLGTPVSTSGARHPIRGNVCPKVLLIASNGSFEQLMDRTFYFARALAGL
jgi:hypothetical protein